MKQLRIVAFALGILVLSTTLQPARAQDSLNCTLVARCADGSCRAVAVVGSIAYHGNGDYLEVFDVSDPANPIELVKVLTPSKFMGVAVRDNYAYVANHQEGLRIIDVSDPSNPTESGYCDTGHWAHDVAVSDNYAYVADGEAGLGIIDMSDPSNPTESGYYDTHGFAFGVAVSGNHAYVADFYYGLRIIDISDPTNPTESGYYDTGDYACGVAVSGSYAYVADWGDGLYIIHNDFVSGVSDNDLPLPSSFMLNQNYPNPFNPVTQMSYQLPRSVHVTLKIYNTQGQEIRTLVNEEQTAGLRTVAWDGLDNQGQKVTTGIYLCRMDAGEFSDSKKMILVQ